MNSLLDIVIFTIKGVIIYIIVWALISRIFILLIKLVVCYFKTKRDFIHKISAESEVEEFVDRN